MLYSHRLKVCLIFNYNSTYGFRVITFFHSEPWATGTCASPGAPGHTFKLRGHLSCGPWSPRLTVTIAGLAASVVGAVVVLIARLGFLEGGVVVHGWAVFIYGVWAFVIGRALTRLAQSGASALTMGIILSVAGIAMLVTYRWIVDEVRALTRRE